MASEIVEADTDELAAVPVVIGTGNVKGPHGGFVIRADRYGVPIEATLRSGSEDGVLRVIRLLRREKRWVIRVRRTKDDPFGPALFSEIVADRTLVHASITTAKAAVEHGLIGG